MGQPLRPLLRRKVEVEARPSAGTGPIAGVVESAAGNDSLCQSLPTADSRLIMGLTRVSRRDGKTGPVVEVTRDEPRRPAVSVALAGVLFQPSPRGDF